MKPMFDHAKAHYDDWRRRYTAHGLFVAFETGEIVMPLPGDGPLGPDARGRPWPVSNTALAASNDPIRDVTYHTPDGEPLKQSWLHVGGIRYFLQDRCTMTAVCVYPYRNGGVSSVREAHPETAAQWAIVPQQLRNRVAVYWPAAGEQPVGAPVAVCMPRKLTAEQREHVREVTDACRAWYAFGMSSSKTFALDVCTAEQNQHMSRTVWALQAEAAKGINAALLLKTTFNDMSDYNRLRTAIKVEAATETRMFTHLKITKKD